MDKFKTFISLKRETKLLFVEAYFFLGWARILKMISFSKVAPSLGIQTEETSFSNYKLNKNLLRDVSQSVHIMSGYTLWESQCLVKAIAAMKMLERRNIESTLYFGIAKNQSENLIAHAWLRSGPYYITGAEGMERYTVVSKFAKRLNYKESEGDNYE